MELWIPITLAAAFVQNIRFMLQKHLKGQLSSFGATYARFLWAAPLAALTVWALARSSGEPLPGITSAFLIYGMIGGITQIIGTALIVSLFSYRNFAVGATFSKTEAVQAAIIGFVLLGDRMGPGSIIAIVVSVLGVILMSVDLRELSLRGVFTRPTLIGLAAGALLGVSGVTYRGASLALDGGDFLIRAAVTLAVVTAFQTVVMSLYLALKEPGEIGRVLGGWKITSLVGITGMLGSLGWFSAMTLQNAAYVKAVGQVELIFAVLASYFFFKESPSLKDIAGIILVVIGILLLLL